MLGPPGTLPGNGIFRTSRAGLGQAPGECKQASSEQGRDKRNPRESINSLDELSFS